MKKLHTAPYERRTMPLKGTVSRLEAQLDHRSALAVAYAREWHRSGPGATGVDPLASGVIRRALSLYVDHLNRPDTDPQAEARALHACCTSLSPDDEDRQAAIQRLRVRRPGHPFPVWRDVLWGFDRLQKLAALEDRVEEMAADITGSRPARTNRDNTA